MIWRDSRPLILLLKYQVSTILGLLTNGFLEESSQSSIMQVWLQCVFQMHCYITLVYSIESCGLIIHCEVGYKTTKGANACKILYSECLVINFTQQLQDSSFMKTTRQLSCKGVVINMVCTIKLINAANTSQIL